MKKTMEKAAILSLSLMLISTFSVSSALPEMLKHFEGYPRDRVEMLISVTSFAIMITIILNTWLSRYVSERASVVIGILLLVAGGITPVFRQEYGIMFAARVILGIGIGLINARAINIINERYTGDEQATLLGFRGASEVLGNAVLTLVAGRLLLIHWKYAFAVYLTGIPILLMYLIFVPASPVKKAEKNRPSDRLGKKELLFVLLYAGLAWLTICVNCSNTMRIPGLVLEKGYGTEADASVILSLMLAVGIVAGIFFGRLEKMLGDKLTVIGLFLFGAGMVAAAYAENLLVLGIGAVFAGIAYDILITCAFYKIGAELPKNTVNLATSIVLVGCNLGASGSPIVLKVIDACSDQVTAPFFTYAAVMGMIGIVYLIFLILDTGNIRANVV